MTTLTIIVEHVADDGFPWSASIHRADDSMADVIAGDSAYDVLVAAAPIVDRLVAEAAA